MCSGLVIIYYTWVFWILYGFQYEFPFLAFTWKYFLEGNPRQGYWIVQKIGDNEHYVFLEYTYLLTLKYVSPRAEAAYNGE
jgi:hypothetical protein